MGTEKRVSRQSQLVFVVVSCMLTAIFVCILRFGNEWYVRTRFGELGGKLLYESSRPIGPAVQTGIELSGPRVDDHSLSLLVRTIKRSTINHRRVVLRNTRVSDAGLLQLSSLSRVESLVLDESEIGDLGIANLSKIDGLESLILDRISVTEQGFAQLHSLSTLETVALTLGSRNCLAILELNERPVPLSRLYVTTADAGLATLPGLNRVKEIYITGDELSDVGMTKLAGIKNVAAFVAKNCEISDLGLRQLLHSRQMQILDLSGTNISDAGVAELRRLGTLRYLDLSDTRITDAGLKSLSSLGSLRTIRLYSTNVTLPGLNALKHANPTITVLER